MIVLEAINPRWIGDQLDDPTDRCAHGEIEFQINDLTIATPDDGEWTINAAAYFLLRTCFESHTTDHPVTELNQLIPCCGFSIGPTDSGKYRYDIEGCPHGIDPSVVHASSGMLISHQGRKTLIPILEWMQAILHFSEQIDALYQRSSPKAPFLDEWDKAGWDYIWSEYRRMQEQIRRIIAHI